MVSALLLYFILLLYHRFPHSYIQSIHFPHRLHVLRCYNLLIQQLFPSIPLDQASQTIATSLQEVLTSPLLFQISTTSNY